MQLTSGTRIGPYEIADRLGAGGMGEVYRARDTRLHRDVAIKVLPAAYAAHPERLARFGREARLLASLNHPHIGAIYGLEETAHVRALVLELVPGETLARRLKRGPLPVVEAVRMARSVAEALDTAHAHGIIHRDLKPGNIMVTPDATVKVLDFGLAKSVAVPAPLEAGVSPGDVETIAAQELTQSGVVVGTTAYMSPEQVRGHPVDTQTDIWAFGCVLFEMLTGRAAFSGPTVSDTWANVLNGTPDWASLPPDTPPALAWLLRRCMAKDRRHRFRDMGDVRLVLEDAGEVVPAAAAPMMRGRRTGLVPWAIAGVAAALLMTLWLVDRERAPASPVAVVRSTIPLSAGLKLARSERSHPFALSPDGTRLAYVGEADGRAELYIRELGDRDARRVPSTTGAKQPFFSPDGLWVGYFTSGGLHKVAVRGGAPLRICDVPTISVGGTWGRDGTIVFASTKSPLARVDAGGGTPQPIQGSGEGIWPQFLPDDRTLLYVMGARTAIAVAPIAGGEPRIVAQTSGAGLDAPVVLGVGGVHPARYVGGFLVYGQDPGHVRVVPFDLATLTLGGSPISLIDGVERAPGGGAIYFAASDTGVLAHASTGYQHRLVWVDRDGAETPISSDRDAFRGPELSPDGRHLAIAINDGTRRSDLWIYDLDRSTKRRLTTERHNLAAVWTPDGGALTFGSGMPGDERIEELALDGKHRRLLLQHPTMRPAYPFSWSPDGEDLLYATAEETGSDIWVFSRTSGTARALLAGAFNFTQPQLSRNGGWMAFSSDESGRYEVYAARYPALDRRQMLSTEGGRYPRWSRDGRVLFYRQGDALMEVALDPGEDLRPQKPRRILSGSYTGVAQNGDFDVAPDGRRFVMVKSDPESTLQQLTLIQNWPTLLGR